MAKYTHDVLKTQVPAVLATIMVLITQLVLQMLSRKGTGIGHQITNFEAYSPNDSRFYSGTYKIKAHLKRFSYLIITSVVANMCGQIKPSV